MNYSCYKGYGADRKYCRDYKLKVLAYSLFRQDIFEDEYRTEERHKYTT
jgi:hypothetical protein